MCIDTKRKEFGETHGSYLGVIDYTRRVMSLKEKILYMTPAAGIIFALSFIFYRSYYFSALLSIFALLYPKIKNREIIQKRKNELNLQFKDMLYALASSMSAGKPLELAFKDVLRDLSVQYPETEASILVEVVLIIRRLEMNETAEHAIADFARRSQIQDIKDFSDVVQICKRSGGNLVEVVKNTSNIINDKIEIRQEIDTLLAQRKLEQKLLNILPPAMLLLLSLSAGDYIQPVFSTNIGRIVMSVCILLLAAAYFLSKRIADIKV